MRQFKNFILLVLFGVIAQVAVIGATNASAAGVVSFTFDDGWDSTSSRAADILASHGAAGTLYMTTGYAEQPGFMSWADIDQLSSMGWEIACHSDSHPLLTEVTPEQLAYEMSSCKDIMLAHGYDAQAIATPFGDYSSPVVAAAAKLYSTHRGFHDIGYNSYPYTDYLLNVQQVQIGVSVETVKGYIDEAIANDQWLILVFHDIQDTPDVNRYEYEYASNELDQIAAYAKSSGITIANVSETVADINTSLVPSNFTNGIVDGWTTDSPGNVYGVNDNSGSYPEPQNAVSLNSDQSKNVHLFSPTFEVNSGQQYAVETYVKVNTADSVVAFYVDEYDALNNWISGQYITQTSSPEIQSVSFLYIPTSGNVSLARVQVIVVSGLNRSAVLDSFKVYNTTSVQDPIPDPDPDPTPETVNHLLNPDFSLGLNSWSTDSPSNISSSNSVVNVANKSTNSHLFSNKVAVSQGVQYRAAIDVSSGSASAVGLYIDEYDVNGQWISGRYLGTWVTTASVQTISANYIGSSANVASSSLQVIFIGGASTNLVADNAELSSQVVAPTEPPVDPPTDPPVEPPVEPPVDPPAQSPNLIPNGDIEGSVNSWATDAATGLTYNTVLRSALVSSNPERNTHIFSEFVNVLPSTSYSVASEFSCSTSGVVAIYIDEYDAQGNWISGKYISEATSGSAATASAIGSYIPTSANVAKVKLQLIVVKSNSAEVNILSANLHSAIN